MWAIGHTFASRGQVVVLAALGIFSSTLMHLVPLGPASLALLLLCPHDEFKIFNFYCFLVVWRTYLGFLPHFRFSLSFLLTLQCAFLSCFPLDSA